MKNLTAIMITLAMLCTVSCTGNTNTPAQTTVTTPVGSGVLDAPSETTETTVPVTETETVETTVTTAGTTAETAEPFDVDAFLADCTVYEVTTETITAPLDELIKMSDFEKPTKIALRFTDAEGLTICMDSAESDYGIHYYYVKYIFNGVVDIPVFSNKQFEYRYVGFEVRHKNGTTIIENSDGHGGYVTDYIIKDNEYYILENDATETGYSLSVYFESVGGLGYTKTASKYHVNSFEAFLMAYESDEDFYMEYGSVAFENGEIIFVANETITIGEGRPFSVIDKYYEKYGVGSLSELVEIYKQYLAEGRQTEFLELN